MTNRERILAVLDHRPPDRIPWIPRLKLWYQARKTTDTMPRKWDGLSLREIERDLGVGTPAREAVYFEIVYDGVERVERWEDDKKVVEFHTPKGTVRSVEHTTETLRQLELPGRVEEFLLKGPRDYRVWEYVVEHTRWKPRYDEYRSYDKQIGDDGLPLARAGDVPFHEFAQALAGYENAFYHLADHTSEVEHLLEVMREVHRERLWPVMAKSPARLFLHGLHLSSQFTPPYLFERYVTPYYEQLMPYIHSHGKSVAMHADNDTSQILDHIARAGWDMLECFITAPMVPLTMEQARATWGESIILWGGIPSNLLAPSVPEEEFRDYVNRLLDVIAPGDAFILGIADNVMPDSVIDRIVWVSELVEQRGNYPIEAKST